MRGVVPLGAGRVEVREVPDPRPGPGEAVVALRNAGICGSDNRPDRYCTKLPEACDIGQLNGA